MKLRVQGMQAKINARRRSSARMLQLLAANKASLQWFFGTANPEKIADEDIQLT